LVPRLQASETNAKRAEFQAAARDAAVGIVARLPAPHGAVPDTETTRRVLAAVDRYAVTSPEMTMFGRIVLEALPAA
jgi:hypothetical protein